MQCACSILSPVAFYALQYFSTSHKRRDFRKYVTGHKMCVLISTTNLPETFLILIRIQRDVLKLYINPPVKYSLLSPDCNEN